MHVPRHGPWRGVAVLGALTTIACAGVSEAPRTTRPAVVVVSPSEAVVPEEEPVLPVESVPDPREGVSLLKVLPIAVEHESCDVSAASALRVDVNGDGRPDVLTFVDGARKVCRAADLNFDGTPDLYEYFDVTESVRRVERDLDGDAEIDEVSLYEGERVVGIYRDTSGDGRFDVWTEWSAVEPGCSLVTVDRDLDGIPDDERKECAVR